MCFVPCDVFSPFSATPFTHFIVVLQRAEQSLWKEEAIRIISPELRENATIIPGLYNFCLFRSAQVKK